MRVVVILACLGVPGIAAAAEPVLFRLYLTDGTSVVSYGEFARVDDRVVFSMVLGGAADPRLQAATLPASFVNWTRTDLHATSTRYQWYVQTRAEEDFQRLSDEVAGVLNAILLTKDRARALDLARQARTVLATWPRDHYGYRQRDVHEILAVLDEVITDLRAAAGSTAFDLTLVASAPEVALEPLASMPSPREQIDQALRVAALTDRPSERIALLHSVLLVLNADSAVIPAAEAARVRRVTEARIRDEERIDKRYADLGRRLMAAAARGAKRGRSDQVEQILKRIPREDARLGRRRPEMVQALHTSVQAQLAASRRLRLLRDQWMIRRSLYTDYQRSVGGQLLQLVKSQPTLEAIRRLDGPPPDLLLTLQGRLRGGAERLERVRPPLDLRPVHDLLLGAWRFAENAVNRRYEAARAADVAGAWEASSAAAGALLMLSRAQQELQALLAPPQLQ